MWRRASKHRLRVRGKTQVEDGRTELLKRLHWLMFFRVVVITFLLGCTVLVQLKQTTSYITPFLIYLYSFVGTVYVLTIIYILTLSWIKNLPVFAYLQIILDTFLITFLVYFTGGKESIFQFMYFLSIITGSILVYRKGGFLVASICSVLYGGLLDLEFYGVIHPIYGKVIEEKGYESTDLFYSILINITAFYLVAFLSSLLSEQARKSKSELQKKQVDFDQLEALNRNIVQSISGGLLATDLEGRVTFFNKVAEEITGYNCSQVYHSNVEEILPFLKDRKGIFKEPSNPGHPPFRFESRFKKEDGNVLYLGFSISPLKDSSGEELGSILTFQDLTRFKEMEEHIKMVDRLAAVGRLSAGIAHEMRNPLASVSGSIQVLKEELALEDRNERLMDIAIRETDRLNSLITDFMLFAQPGLGKKEVVNVTRVVRDTLNEFISSPEWNNAIEVVKDFSGDIKVEADPKQLEQVLRNLFVNAVQAMPEGGNLGIEVRRLGPVSAGKLPAAKILEIIVRDTGCGIPKENQDKVFDPFFTTKDRGTGMGLAIAYRIIESYKGRIVVESEGEQGTSFTIYLPVASV